MFSKKKKIQKKLPTKDDKLDSKSALDICRTQEATVTHMAQLHNLYQPTETSVSAVKSTPQLDICKYCGRSHAPKACPAYKTNCALCGKRVHWRIKCHTRMDSKNQSKREPQRSYDKNKRHSDNVHSVSHDHDSEAEGYVESLMFESIEINNVQATPENDVRDEVFADLDITLKDTPVTHTLKVKIDTGAQGMYPDKKNKDGYPKPGSIQSRSTILKAYNKTVIKQYGIISIPCEKGEQKDHVFYVGESEGPAILGLPSSRNMKLVTLNCSIRMGENLTASETFNDQTTRIVNKETVLALYPDRFSGIGKFPGEFHVTLKEEAEPVVHATRKYPIHLKQDNKTELEKLESMDVITKITDPTDLVSSLVFSRKSNGQLRVCLDPKDLNKAVKRTYHKVPTMEELTHKLSGAKVFSKIDARHGYWSVVLDEESSYLATFNSPEGRYRFKRLPFGLKVSPDIFQERMGMILEECLVHLA